MKRLALGMGAKTQAAIWLSALALLAACDSGDSGADGTGGGVGASTNVGGTGGTGGNTSSGTTSGTGGEEVVCDPACPPGQRCSNGTCVDGCTTTEPCGEGLSCCDGACVDLTSDIDHCGSCPHACPQPANMVVTCVSSACTMGGCETGYFDCDGTSDNGCESTSQCSCTPGATQPCYSGLPSSTQNNPPCQAGYQTCNAAGTAWSLCYDEVVPADELCSNSIDEDCNGVVDDVPDVDGDGWTACDNDCCETSQDCADPVKVNPGAFEMVGNSVDDDCDPATSDATDPPPCSTAQDFSVTPNQMAEAIDLCQFTTANPPLANRKWGVISASFRTPAGGTPSSTQLNSMQNNQAAVLQNYGTVITPQLGPTMAGISSGWMRDQNDPNYVGVNSNSAMFGFNQNPPASYLAAHGGSLPASYSCNPNPCSAGSGANDGVNLRLQIRVPTNALSFAYQFRFFTAEYWNYACSSFNDFYLALLQTGAAGIPADHNISFDSLNNPVSVNNGFFEVCTPHGCYTCPSGAAALAGTGMQVGPEYGGGTIWLQTTAPVVPGETMVLELMIFDVSDDWLDSLAVLDAFEWSIDASGVGTGPPG